MPKSRSKHRTHKILINKKSGKVASINNEINVLCTEAYYSGENRGIMSVLYAKGQKISLANKLVVKNKRGGRVENTHRLLREQAIEILPSCAALYELHRPKHLAPSRMQFASWIKTQLHRQGSAVYSLAASLQLYELLETHRSKRWWLDRLKKMQS